MSQGGNIFNQSAAAMSGAGDLYRRSANMYGNAGLTGGAAVAANPSRILSGIDRYMNPYTEDVINRTLMNVGRMNDIQLNQVGADATKAGAFGGARHGLVEAATNAESQRTMGDITANLLNEGFNTAAGLSAQDIQNLQQNRQFNTGVRNNWDQAVADNNLRRAAGLTATGDAARGLGGMMYGVGTDLNENQAQAGSLVQQLIQQVMGGAQSQYQQFMTQPQNLLNMQLAALGMNPMTTATTTTSTNQPGLFDYLGLGGKMWGTWLGRPA